MKKLRLFPGAALCLALTLGMTVPAMADSGSWQQDNEGRWKYITESGTGGRAGLAGGRRKLVQDWRGREQADGLVP